MHKLHEKGKTALLERYANKFPVKAFDYGTVRDYCDSCDHLPCLSMLQHDLKDLQRPWTVKAALGLVSVGSRLLEIGAGQPLVAALLEDLGYDVTIIDPYDGSAGGPTDFEQFVRYYPKLRIIRNQFRLNLPELEHQTFDGIYSISVLEHVPEPLLGELFEAVSVHLRPGGQSFHSVDCVTQGTGAAYHLEQCFRILTYQQRLAGKFFITLEEFTEFFANAALDLETFYLSGAGHHLWRGGAAYDTFPFRKVLSFHTAESKAAK